MASTKRTWLPKMFEPLLQQAQTAGALRYGAQETGLLGLLGDTNRNYTRQAAAQEGATRSLLGSLQGASVNLNNAYSDAGLTPEVRAQYANTPDGQRILASLARGQGDIQTQQLGAQAGRQYLQQRMAEDYNSDVGKINDQLGALRKERGLFESSTLDSLIGENRAGRAKLNADARQRQADADAAVQAQNAARDNALIGQGLLPGADGTLQPLPGGKADPNAPGNKPKRTSGPGTASQDAQRSAGNDFTRAFGFARGMAKKTKDPSVIAAELTSGREAGGGETVYEDVKVKDPVTGAVKVVRRPKLDKKTHAQITTPTTPKVDPVPAPIAQAAAEQAILGYVTTKTVRALQAQGYSVRQIPGFKTENQWKASTRKPVSRPNRPAAPKNAPSGYSQDRPT